MLPPVNNRLGVKGKKTVYVCIYSCYRCFRFNRHRWAADMAAAAALLLAALTLACSAVSGNLVRMKLKVFYSSSVS